LIVITNPTAFSLTSQGFTRSPTFIYQPKTTLGTKRVQITFFPNFCSTRATGYIHFVSINTSDYTHIRGMLTVFAPNGGYDQITNFHYFHLKVRHARREVSLRLSP
jgi:hypothetical protein